MTDILCRWLNDDVELSICVEKESVSKLFASGYLFGEILFKYGLQDDFTSFSKTRTSDSKLNNFTRIESVVKLLEIPYDTNVAKAIMNENHGAATKLLYQLFIALGRKAKKNLTGVAMETMRPSAPVKLESIESGMHKERLKKLVPRQVDVNFETLVEKYQTKQRQQEEMAFKAKQNEEMQIKKYQQDLRQRGLEKARLIRDKQNDVMQKIKDTQVKIPKPPASKKSSKTKQETRKDLEIQEVKDHIDSFEASMRTNLPPASPVEFESELEIKQNNLDGRVPRMPLQPITVKNSGDDYVLKIKRKLNEDAVARQEREKRRRRVLGEQLKAHEVQEEQRREEMLVKRLMRQSQQEKRIAVQLMQVRHEKQIIKENRIFRERQYAERRVRDFEDALNLEAEMCRLAQIEYQEETRKAEELRQELVGQRRGEKYQKHYHICQQILSEIVDFSCKIGEYRELIEGNVPEKLFREWKGLFDAGIPLYPRKNLTEDDIERAKELALEQEKRHLTDESDFVEYRNVVGEWQSSENDVGAQAPPNDNPILGHIIQRLLDIISPPEVPPPPPEFPPFPVKACFLGKFFSGKTTAVERIVSGHRLVRLCVDVLVQDAIEAHEAGEEEEEEIVEDNEDEVGNISEPQAANCDQSLKENQDPNDTESSAERKNKNDESDGHEIRQEKEPHNPTKKPTLRALLGVKSFGFLKRGKQIPDQLLVDIMVEAIRQVPPGTGWIMDGFPSTVNQAKILEKALTGYDDAKEVKTKETKGKTKRSRIAADPRPPPETPPPKSGIDIVILFDLPDDVVLKRAEGRTYNPTTEEKFHQEFKPPVDGSYTGLGKQEKVLPVGDPSNDREQVQQRITGFDDSWSKLERWFNKFGILTKVDVEKSADDVFETATSLLIEKTEKVQGASQEQSTTNASDIQISKSDEAIGATHISPADEIVTNMTEGPSDAQPPFVNDDVEAITESKPSKEKADPKTVSPKPSKKNSKKDRSPSPKTSKKGVKTGSRPNSRKGSPSPSRKGSKIKSPSASRTDSKRAKSPVKGKPAEVEEEPPAEPAAPSGPEPGSEDWTYVDQPIDMPLVSILTCQWENLEQIYIETSKKVFGEIRDERELIYRYFYGTRKEFISFLRRPDEKEEYVLQWQKNYNEVADDTRNDDDMKAELHEQADDLGDRLYEICDNRKEMAENERLGVMSEGWLEDRLGLLTNHYLTLMQVEVDRYQDTVRVLKDYYKATEGKTPSEGISEICRVPLVELPPTIQEISSSASDVGSQNEVKQTSSRKDRESLKTPEATSEGDEHRHRIPLVPRRPKSGDIVFNKDKKDKRSSQKRDKADNQAETPVLPTDPDERLVFDGFFNAVSIIDTLASLDQAEQEEEANKLADTQREKEREKEKEKEITKKTGKDKKEKKGKKSASKMAVTKPESPPPVVDANTEADNEEEKLEKELQGKARREFLAAVGFEDTALRTRLEIIRNRSVGVLQELKGKAELTYKDMDDWLGARFLQEMESIRVMANLARTAIENEQKLQRQLILEDKDFVVDLNINVFKTPSPPPPPSPREFDFSDSFTVVQLEHLYTQFIDAAPSGVISCRAFVDIVLDLMSTSFGMEMLPDIWMNQTALQLHSLAVLISQDSEFINWKRFLVLAAYPFPRPSRFELFDTLSRFLEIDSIKTCFVSEEQFSKVDLWFVDSCEYENVDSTETTPVYPRQNHLKQLFFKVFSDSQRVPPMLNYEDMLLYFAMDENSVEGFLRALIIVCRQPMLSSSSLQTELHDDHEETETGTSPTVEKDISNEPGADSLVTLNSLLKVFHHGENQLCDTHRFEGIQDFQDPFSKDRLGGVFIEFGVDQDESLPFYLLYRHPIIQDCIHMCQRYKYFDLKDLLKCDKLDALTE